MVRPGAGPARPGDVTWGIEVDRIDEAALEGFDVVVHLAGANIASGRWTNAMKDRLRKSRVDGSQLLSRALAKMQRPPRVLVQASAVGFYGDRGEETLTEKSERGRGFLPALCVAWESAAEPAEKRGIRTVFLRFGVILSARGGALAKMLLPFRLGVGGILGSGSQYVSWITLDDAVGIILHALATEGLNGPVNAVAPRAVTNREFTKTLGGVLKRPTIFPMPAFAARLAFGEMADALLLSSARVVPERLQATGFRYRHAELEPALRHVLSA
jgi:uncharacterized protein (TIGR01777 family)